MRLRCVRFGVASLVIVGMVVAASAAHAMPVLWNRLGSAQQVLNSSYGPNLSFYGGGTWPDVAGNAAYVPGVFGDALTIGPGSYGSLDRVHTVVWENVHQHLNPERGTIEVWFRQTQNPVPFEHGVYRIFDGSYGLGSGISFTSEYSHAHSAPLLIFGLEFGGVMSSVQHNISPMNGNWIHLAGVWDRQGIAGSEDKVRLYIDGALVASNPTSSWGNTMGTRAGIGGGNDGAIANKFAIDNLKVFGDAMTDFSHRFEEGWIPEPALVGLLAPALLACRRRR